MPYDPAGWAEADTGRGGDAPPDGLYEAELAEGKVITTRDDRDNVLLVWSVVSGPHRDAQWESWHTLERFKADGERNPGLSFTKEALRVMGFPVNDPDASASLDAIREALAPLVGKGYTIEVKRSGTFVNTYVKGVLESYAVSLPGSGGDSAPAYGQQRQPTNAIMGHDGGGTSAPPQSLTQMTEQRVDVERTGESDVTTPVDVQAFETPPQRGDIDPETGEPIPF